MAEPQRYIWFSPIYVHPHFVDRKIWVVLIRGKEHDCPSHAELPLPVSGRHTRQTGLSGWHTGRKSESSEERYTDPLTQAKSLKHLQDHETGSTFHKPTACYGFHVRELTHTVLSIPILPLCLFRMPEKDLVCPKTSMSNATTTPDVLLHPGSHFGVCDPQTFS